MKIENVIKKVTFLEKKNPSFLIRWPFLKFDFSASLSTCPPPLRYPFFSLSLCVCLSIRVCTYLSLGTFLSNLPFSLFICLSLSLSLCYPLSPILFLSVSFRTPFSGSLLNCFCCSVSKTPFATRWENFTHPCWTKIVVCG